MILRIAGRPQRLNEAPADLGIVGAPGKAVFGLFSEPPVMLHGRFGREVQALMLELSERIGFFPEGDEESLGHGRECASIIKLCTRSDRNLV